MHTESSAAIQRLTVPEEEAEQFEIAQLGLEVCYVSYGKRLYDAKIARVHERGICDLTVYDSADGKVPLGKTIVYQATYDSIGAQPHSWHKKTDAKELYEVWT